MKVVDKVKDWVRTHKKETALTIGGIAAGTALVIIGVKKYNESKMIDPVKLFNFDFSVFLDNFASKNIAEKEGLKIPDMGDISCLDLTKDGENGFVVWLKDCGIEKMGELGEGLKKIEGLTPGTTATMVCLWDYTKDNK